MDKESQEILKRVEERLTRLEASATAGPAAGGFGAPGGAVVDPAPWGPGGGFVPRWPVPHPIADPAPWWPGGGFVPPRWPVPNPVADPAPWPPGGFVPRWPVPPIVADPAPWGGGIGGGTITRPPIGPIGDPPPMDLGRLNLAQLESSMHSINAEKARLDSLEKLINNQIGKLKNPG